MSDEDLLLSGRVLKFIEREMSPKRLRFSPEERAEAERWDKIAEAIVDRVIASREVLTNRDFPEIEQIVKMIPDAIAVLLDVRFTKNLVLQVPGCVVRLMELSHLQSQEVPSQVTNTYLQEAVRTYILGLPLASVALSRAAMEQAIKEGLGYQGKRVFVQMNDLLDEAESTCGTWPQQQQ